MERYILAARELLTRHYSPEDALSRAQEVALRFKDEDGQLIPEALLAITLEMSKADTPWWDSESAVVRATEQLRKDTLLLPSLEAFVEDIETATGRSLGDTPDDKFQALDSERWEILHELAGDPLPPQNPLEAMLQQMGISMLHMSGEEE